ncbi:LacI family DNA-binding transcriptional regulator [Mucilaginibacter sp.]|uniref:LacI family DNA-binding transcriptional regulator n=1 Tax=Mucilaginibacter sp. TaxID=1882438 RepID=UPI00261B30B0|nr:LacI family DNA-binding transcriptional regulator [Mucilaginibacter sp.]MDB4919433.1 Transcriptional regulator, LacI family [Mucilaginibacter sp.]
MEDNTDDKKINMKALAKVLNLSTATISKALRDSYDISDQTKSRVKEAASRLNYVTNPHASSLRKHLSNTIAIVIPEIADSFFSQVINGIESIAGKEKYHFLIYLTHDSYEREVSILNEFTSGRVDGILISVASNTSDTAHISKLQQAGMPIVFFDRDCAQLSAASVTTDDFNSAYIAASHMIAQGCKNISLITVQGYVSIFSSREEGYKKALSDMAITSDGSNLIYCVNKYTDENIALIRDHLISARPDGLLLTVEHLATSAYLACHEIKLRIPNDIKIACFTNQITAPVLNPPLTTILQPAYEMGQKAGALLFEYLSHNYIKLEEEHIIIPSKLVIRESTTG